MKSGMSRKDIERIQFNGLYQLSSERPCNSCKTATVKSSEYRVTRIIGSGTFGRVYQVQENSSGQEFAMKVMQKETLLKTSEPSHFIQERRMLASISNPFIVSYETHFQTKTELCLVMEYVDGSDLYHLHRKEGHFDQEAVRFYLSEILLPLEYLHHLGVIYRDLKLENILIDKTGHVKIVDLGFSRALTNGEKCKTFCGTADYQAPEILQGKEYDNAVDWWAFGILAYELRAGSTPFSSAEENLKLRLQEISEKIESYQELVDLVRNLLEKNPLQRLGSQLLSVRNHVFFSQVNFDKVYRKEIKPPFSSLPEMDVRQGTEDDVNPIGNENDITDTVFEDF